MEPMTTKKPREALDLIHKDRIDKFISTENTTPEIQVAIDKLLEYMGRIDWSIDKDDFEEIPFPQVKPLESLFKAISILRKDFVSIINEKKLAEKRVKVQNELNRLRLEIWGLGSRLDLGYDDFIQEFLNTMVALKSLKRICYYDFHVQKNSESELRCTAERRSNGFSSNLGKAMPHSVYERLARGDREYLIVKKRKANVNNLLTCLILPFKLSNFTVGYFSFDFENGSSHDSAALKDKVQFIKSLIKIVEVFLFQKKSRQDLFKAHDKLEVKVRQRTEKLTSTMNELVAARKLAEEANKSKSRFLANMSHELRTPLNSILGFSQILSMQQMGSLNEKQLEYIKDIHSSGEHLLEMVNDVLDLSKIEANKVLIEKKPFNLNLMLSRSPSTIKVISDKKRVEMSLDIPPDLGEIEADEVRIKQVIFNLLSNAIKFTDPGKQIGIKARKYIDSVLVEVWDEGCGIPEFMLVKIFDPFEQVKSAERGKPQGTGLGLAISKKIIELHGGTLEVKSTLDIGSRFTVTLPVGNISSEMADKKEPNSLPDSLSSKDDSRMDRKILIVEDNDKNAKLMNDILNINNYNFSIVHSGEQALVEITKDNYKLVLMDIQLLGMSGTETMKKMRKMPIEDLPILALTAHAMKEDKKKFILEGFENYISKPIEINNMLSKINMYLG